MRHLELTVGRLVRVTPRLLRLDTCENRTSGIIIITMVAYQAESDLVHRLTPHYRRTADDGRTLVQSALMSAADLDVTEDELRVTFAPLSAPRRTRAIAALCQELNACQRPFPGSRLRLRFAVATADDAPTQTVL